MSTALASVSGSGTPSDELLVMQRIRQIQELTEQAASSAAGGVSAPQAGSFAAALQAASGPVAQQASMAFPNGESGAGSQYDQLIEQAAARNGVDPAILHGLIQQESGFDPNATSSAGALGLTQLMPGTASSLGVTNPLDPAQSIEGGARYLSQMMSEFGGNTEEALAAYNAGSGAVQHYGGIPPYPETEAYVAKVLADAETYRRGGVA